MSNRFLVIILTIIVIFGGVLIANNRDGDEATDVAAEPTSHYWGAIANPEGENDVTGTEPAEDAVVLVEYGDFQCSACAQYYPIVEQLKEKYKDRLAFQFRHFPLVAIHPNTMAAHKASEAAANQGKFWEMYDLLYQRQTVWQGTSNPTDTFAGYAEELGLDMERYSADIASSEVNAKVQADLQAGRDLNVSGTPTFVLEGESIESPTSLEAFETLIEQAIQNKSTS